MQRSRRTLVAIGLLVVGLQLAACTQQSAAGDGATNEPATVEHIRAISNAGERMPAKSTYFYPKLLSGLVINPIE